MESGRWSATRLRGVGCRQKSKSLITGAGAWRIGGSAAFREACPSRRLTLLRVRLAVFSVPAVAMVEAVVVEPVAWAPASGVTEPRPSRVESNTLRMPQIAPHSVSGLRHFTFAITEDGGKRTFLSVNRAGSFPLRGRGNVCPLSRTHLQRHRGRKTPWMGTWMASYIAKVGKPSPLLCARPKKHLLVTARNAPLETMIKATFPTTECREMSYPSAY